MDTRLWIPAVIEERFEPVGGMLNGEDEDEEMGDDGGEVAVIAESFGDLEGLVTIRGGFSLLPGSSSPVKTENMERCPPESVDPGKLGDNFPASSAVVVEVDPERLWEKGFDEDRE